MPEDRTTGSQTTTTNAQAPTTGEAQTQTPATFEAWLETAPDDLKGLVTGHIESLRNTVQATRRERDELAQQVKKAAKGLEEGSAARQSLEQLSGQLEAAERRATFYEDAARPEIGCTNTRLAYLAAVEDGLIDARGRVNWEAMKTKYSELFRQVIPRGNAGNGAGATPPPTGGMNAYIRRAAGRE